MTDRPRVFRHFLTVGVDRNCQLPWFVSPKDAGRTPRAGV